MQIIVNTVVLASLYSLICCGFVLIYRSSHVVNLAQGELMAMGGYLLFSVVMNLFKDPFPSFLAASLFSLALGVMVYFFLMRFMAGESIFAAILSTIALGILFRGLVTLIWTSQLWHPLEKMGITNSSHGLIKDAVISTFGIVTVLSALFLYVGLFLCLKFTRLGLRMRAVGENPLLASRRGIKLHNYYALAWGIAAFTGGFAGMIQSCDAILEPGMAVIGLKAFPVVLVGGLDSLAGVIPGAFIVAMAEVIAINYISPQASEAAPFIVLLIMLLIRPWGLFGTKEELERV
jgi:branched-chain amino acid transport system permease protein